MFRGVPGNHWGNDNCKALMKNNIEADEASFDKILYIT